MFYIVKCEGRARSMLGVGGRPAVRPRPGWLLRRASGAPRRPNSSPRLAGLWSLPSPNAAGNCFFPPAAPRVGLVLSGTDQCHPRIAFDSRCQDCSGTHERQSLGISLSASRREVRMAAPDRRSCPWTATGTVTCAVRDFPRLIAPAPPAARATALAARHPTASAAFRAASPPWTSATRAGGHFDHGDAGEGVARAGKLGAAWFKHHRDRRQRGRNRSQGPRRRDRRAGGENGADPRHPEAAQRPPPFTRCTAGPARASTRPMVRGLQVGRQGRPSGGGWDLRTTSRAWLYPACTAVPAGGPAEIGRWLRGPQHHPIRATAGAFAVSRSARRGGPPESSLATPELPGGPGSARGGSSVTGSAALPAGERVNRCAHLLRQRALKGGGEF